MTLRNLTVALLDLEMFEICMVWALGPSPWAPHGDHMYHLNNFESPTSGGFWGGGGGHTRPVPPLLKPKKTPINVSVHINVSDSPPPPLISWFGTCATFDAGGAPEKKCRIPPPPLPLISFFGTCATFEAGGAAVRKKKTVCCAPLF